MHLSATVESRGRGCDHESQLCGVCHVTATLTRHNHLCYTLWTKTLHITVFKCVVLYMYVYCQCKYEAYDVHNIQNLR